MFETNFKKYSSISNTYATKDIRWWLGHCPELAELEIVLMEKIDGSNIQLLFTPEQPMKIGKRSTWASTFQNLDRLLPEKYGDEMKMLQDICDISGSQIRLYGEVFGAGVINRVYYGEKSVLFFDMELDNVRLPIADVIKKFAAMEMSHMLVPIIGVYENLDAALKFNVEDCVSRLYPEWPDGRANLWEGVVMKPYTKMLVVNETPDNRGSVFSLKMKRESFSEHNKGAKTKAEIPQTILDMNEAFLEYITDNRIITVFSHEGKIQTARELGKYIKLVQEDARLEFIKDNHKAGELEKSEARRVFNAGKKIAGMLKKHL